jgi:phosphoribosylglycinamide formyltransferase-1
MKIKKVKVAILISGRGTNMLSLIKACKNQEYPAEIAVVISNKKDAPGLEIAKQNNIKTVFINHKDYGTREEFDRQLTKAIEEHNCKIVCLAGFMRLLSEQFVKKWHDRLINVHPSLLPAFKGQHAVHDALKYGVKITGCTVHYVNKEMDSGPIIRQAAVEVLESDNKETLASRILQKEHIIYKEALEIVCKNIAEKK